MRKWVLYYVHTVFVWIEVMATIILTWYCTVQLLIKGGYYLRAATINLECSNNVFTGNRFYHGWLAWIHFLFGHTCMWIPHVWALMVPLCWTAALDQGRVLHTVIDIGCVHLSVGRTHYVCTSSPAHCRMKLWRLNAATIQGQLLFEVQLLFE